MPVICPIELFNNNNILYLFEDKKFELIGDFLCLDFCECSLEKCHYIVLKNGSKIIAFCSYFFYKIDKEKVPAIDYVFVEEYYRNKGICKFFYNYLFKISGKLISGNCLSTTNKKDGSFGIWLRLIEKNDVKLFDVVNEKISDYSFYKAFKSIHNYRRRLICYRKN